MATDAQRAVLRDMISEPDDTNGWTDEKLDEILEATKNTDGSLNYRKAAAMVWEAKAAALTTLNDVTESGSSRRLSQTFEHTLKMAALYGAGSSDPTLAEVNLRPQSQRIVRATRE